MKKDDICRGPVFYTNQTSDEINARILATKASILQLKHFNKLPSTSSKTPTIQPLPLITKLGAGLFAYTEASTLPLHHHKYQHQRSMS